MKKVIISALVASSLFASVDLSEEVELLKQQVAELQKTLKKANINSIKENVKELKIKTGGNNLKFDVDFRTSFDSIRYKHISGKSSSNNLLMSNRLWLNMKYAPSDDLAFIGQVAYNKAFGDSASHSQANTQPQYANFDWVTSENALNNDLKLRTAYFIYFGENAFGSDIKWTASVGRRPATNGRPYHLREDDNAQSPIADGVNAEVDGASFKFSLDKVTDISGMYFKLCLGRGLTNAKVRFDMSGADYAEDEAKNPDIDLAGFIFVPYDDGQYSIYTMYARAWNMIGFDQQSLNMFGAVSQGMDPMTGQYYDSMMTSNYMMAYAPTFKDVGDIDVGVVTFMANGVGEMINDFLDDTILYASVGLSRTLPNSIGMLGTTDSKSGHSIHIGGQIPCQLTEDAKVGFSYNHGSKYWRPITYAEDTMIGSKAAVRGDAYELYWTKELISNLSMQVRYSYFDYKYTGSNSFFGADGTPYDMKTAKQAYLAGMGPDVVDEAQDLRVYFRYRY